MLTIHRLRVDRASYYLSDLAWEVPPPLFGAERHGEWVGGAATTLGLEGAVDSSRFGALLHGCHPETGVQLRSTRATVLAYDLTFSAPKSASVLFGLGGADVARQVLDSHMEAVRGALGYLDSHAVTAFRRRDGAGEVIATNGLSGGAFTHGVNRNVDPHLHTHVVMANLVHGDDGRWSALDQRGVWAHRHAAAALYEAHLRCGVTARLDLQWTQSPFVAGEIRGVSPALLGEFSSRAADIRRHGFEHGVRSSNGYRVAASVTRAPKPGGTAFEELVPRWRQRATALGYPAELAPERGARTLELATLSEHQFAGALSVAPDGRARRRDVVAAFAHAARNGATAQTVGQLTDLSLPGAGARVGVAEAPYPNVGLVPGPHLLRALGPRPVDPARHAVWLNGARTIDDYRQRWRVNGREALGAERGQPDWPTRRLVDHLRTAQQVESTRTRLGRRVPMTVELGRGR